VAQDLNCPDITRNRPLHLARIRLTGPAQLAKVGIEPGAPSIVPKPTFDPADPAFRINPYSLFAQLRTENPIHWSDAVRGHVVTRYDDVQRAMRDPLLSADRITPFYAAQNAATRSQIETLVRYLGRWLVFRDPPDHTRLRGLVARAFTPKALAGIKPNVETITTHLLDALDGRETCDLVADFSTLLPAYVIMDMLGVPRAMLPEMKSWSDDIKLFIGTSQSTPDKYARAHRRHGRCIPHAHCRTPRGPARRHALNPHRRPRR
jgi:cytochrome P450